LRCTLKGILKAKHLRSLFTFGEIDQRIQRIGLIVFFGGVFWFWFVQILRPGCCDVDGYPEAAKWVREVGWIGSMDRMTEWGFHRTFGYLWFLLVVMRVSDLLGVPWQLVLTVVQSCFYLGSIAALTRVSLNISSRVANMTYLGLMGNFFVMPYLSQSLTDGLYVSLAIVAFALWLRIDLGSEKGSTESPKLIRNAAVACSAAVLIRPAAVWLLAPLLIIVFSQLRRRQLEILGAVANLSVGLSPLLIQMYLNASWNGSLSIFPFGGIGSFQLRHGLLNIKYGTFLGSGGPTNYYSSSALVGDSAESVGSVLGWWVSHPWDGFQLLATKIVGVFDYDFLVPYPYARSGTSWISGSLSLSILLIGLIGVGVKVLLNRLPGIGAHSTPIAILGSWAVVTLGTGVELRFSLPMVAYFVFVGANLIDGVIQSPDRLLRRVVVILFVGTYPVIIAVAHFVRSQSSV
jgi:hypothetical protein